MIQVRAITNRMDKELKNKGNVKNFTLQPEYRFYTIIEKPWDFEKGKILFKYLIVNREKYKMDKEEFNNMLKCYNVYNNVDRRFDFRGSKEDKQYIKNLETITDVVTFEYEGKEYTFKIE